MLGINYDWPVRRDMLGRRSVVATAIGVVLVLSFLPGLVRGASSPLTSAGAFPPRGELDCNGFSTVQTPLAPILDCAHPRGAAGTFEDNHHYIGHDEPEMRYISDRAGTGNSMTYNVVLPVNNTGPSGHPSYQDFITFWFGLAVCDNNSYPQQTCFKDSNRNTGLGVNATDAGSAVMELQFYPPGFPNFFNAVSCDAIHWCAAMNIDSLACSFLFKFCNPRCIEPVNFAFITRDGVPIGPPSPQHATLATFDVPTNPDVFLMTSGDQIRVTIQDSANGLFEKLQDLTTGTSGTMVASAVNGFMNTNLHTCAGTPYTFHPEYASASINNLVPWTALQLGPGMAVETGHFEFQDTAQDPARGGDDRFCLTGPSGATVCLGTDFDFDGIPYHTGGWATGLKATASNARPIILLPSVSGMLGPVSHGSGYGMFELESIAGFTVAGVTSCNILVPNSCGLPNATAIPTFGGFYPFYSASDCIGTFGDVMGPDVQDFGGDAGYGSSVPVFSGSLAIFGTNGAFYTNSC